MRRRGNKSTKVPNVKLRPAEPQKPTRRERTLAEPTQLTSDDTEIFDACPRPFNGMVLCATGIPDKREIFKLASELGATSASAFTDRVTHLIASEHGGAKYTCAVERKIPILRPEWVRESHAIWLKGDDVDLEESLEKYCLPVFSGTIICVSGIEDLDRRTKINKLVTRHQGAYCRNLERPVKVTHLLCSGDEETDKMRYAEKFNARKEANIHLVWEEWFWDSLEYGGRFDETKYQARKPRPERRLAPETTILVEETPNTPSTSAASLSRSASTFLPNPQAFRLPPSAPNVSDLEEEAASISRPSNLALQIQESLLRSRGYEIIGGQLQRSPTKSQSKRIPQDDPASHPQHSDKVDLMSAFRRSNSFAPTRVSSPVQHPFRRAATVGSRTSHRDITDLPLPQDPTDGLKAQDSFLSTVPPQQPVAGPSSPSDVQPVKTGMFAGFTFRALGEAKSATVRQAIEGHDGSLVSEHDLDDEHVDYILVRLASGSKLYAAEEDEDLKAKYRTECWLEKCMSEERICDINEHPAFRPLGAPLPIPGAEHVKLSFSGLDESSACWSRRLVRAFGMNLAAGFSRQSTHLFCPSKSGAKHDKAVGEWNIPVVDLEWFEKIAATGRIPPVVSNPNSINISKNGKARQMGSELEEEERQMNDITNVDDSQFNLQEKRSQLSEKDQALGGGMHYRMGTDPPVSLGIGSGPGVSLSFGLPDFHSAIHSTPADQQQRQFLRTSSSSAIISNSNLEPALGGSSLQSGSNPERSLPSSRRENDLEVVASSNTPSPMKFGNSRSPSKELILDEGLTSLLGKRTKLDSNVQESGSGGQQEQRATKRPRPRPVRQHSGVAGRDGDEPVAPLAPVMPDYDRLNLDEQEAGEGGEGGQESLRVVYEDAAQRDARAKLLGLDQVKGKGRGRGSRKGARAAGF